MQTSEYIVKTRSTVHVEKMVSTHGRALLHYLPPHGDSYYDLIINAHSVNDQHVLTMIEAGLYNTALDRITDATYYNASTRASDQLRSAETLGRSSHKFVSKKSVCWDVERPRAFSRFSIDRTQILNSFLDVYLSQTIAI